MKSGSYCQQYYKWWWKVAYNGNLSLTALMFNLTCSCLLHVNHKYQMFRRFLTCEILCTSCSWMRSGDCLNTKLSSNYYRITCHKDRIVLSLSYFIMWIPIPERWTIYWNRPWYFPRNMYKLIEFHHIGTLSILLY